MEDGPGAWRRGDFARVYAISRVRLPGQADAGPYRSGLAPLEDAHVLHEHGRICWQTARFEEAWEALERALELRERALGPEHAATLSTLERLAALASYTGNRAGRSGAAGRATSRPCKPAVYAVLPDST